jgi:hypothetical protein
MCKKTGNEQQRYGQTHEPKPEEKRMLSTRDKADLMWDRIGWAIVAVSGMYFAVQFGFILAGVN